MKKFLVLLFFFSPYLCLCQSGQFLAFTSVEASNDSVFFEYEWWELDPVIHFKIIFDGEDLCLDTAYATSGLTLCVATNLEEGWHEYYAHLEDGDQLIDSTSVGYVFVYRAALSIFEVASLVASGEARIFDILGREVDVGTLETHVLYVVKFASGKVEKIVFVE